MNVKAQKIGIYIKSALSFAMAQMCSNNKLEPSESHGWRGGLINGSCDPEGSERN